MLPIANSETTALLPEIFQGIKFREAEHQRFLVTKLNVVTSWNSIFPIKRKNLHLSYCYIFAT